jgi:hypothetical protein
MPTIDTPGRVYFARAIDAGRVKVGWSYRLLCGHVRAAHGRFVDPFGTEP